VSAKTLLTATSWLDAAGDRPANRGRPLNPQISDHPKLIFAAFDWAAVEGFAYEQVERYGTKLL
jgi:hypothetical protein